MKILRLWGALAFLAVVLFLIAIVLKIRPNKSSELLEISDSSNTRQVVVSGELLQQQIQQQIERKSNSDQQSVKNTTINDASEGLEELNMWLESLGESVDNPDDKRYGDVLNWETNWPATGIYYARDYLRYVLDDSPFRDEIKSMVSMNPDATFEQLNPMDPNSGVTFHAIDGTVIPASHLESYHSRLAKMLLAKWQNETSSNSRSGITGDSWDVVDHFHDLGNSESERTKKIKEMSVEQVITATPKKRVTQKQPAGRRGHKPTDDNGESEISQEGKSDQLAPTESENVWHLETGEGSGDSVQMEREDEPIGMDDKLGPEDGPENSEN
ncbi:MAG: hypothetical protein OXP71_16745 [Candidatus Poribacteria bacterium]|nr:hypothetical protein [Candidatus Poribacteria bacterium]